MFKWHIHFSFSFDLSKSSLNVVIFCLFSFLPTACVHTDIPVLYCSILVNILMLCAASSYNLLLQQPKGRRTKGHIYLSCTDVFFKCGNKHFNTLFVVIKMGIVFQPLQ